MKKVSSWIALLSAMALVTPAFAGDDKAKDKPAPKPATEVKESSGDAAAEMKAGTGIAKRQPVGEADTFTAGTKVWAWSSITGAKDSTVKHVWKRDGKVLWEKSFEVSSSRYRTWTKRSVKAGSYTVEVQTEDGTVLGSVTFTVT